MGLGRHSERTKHTSTPQSYPTHYHWSHRILHFSETRRTISQSLAQDRMGSISFSRGPLLPGHPTTTTTFSKTYPKTQTLFPFSRGKKQQIACAFSSYQEQWIPFAGYTRPFSRTETFLARDHGRRSSCGGGSSPPYDSQFTGHHARRTHRKTLHRPP